MEETQRMEHGLLINGTLVIRRNPAKDIHGREKEPPEYMALRNPKPINRAYSSGADETTLQRSNALTCSTNETIRA